MIGTPKKKKKSLQFLPSHPLNSFFFFFWSKGKLHKQLNSKENIRTEPAYKLTPGINLHNTK